MVADPGNLSPVPPSAVNDGVGSDINEEVSPSYEIRLTRNAARPFRPIPVVLGKHRVVPPLAAATKSEIDGTDGHLYQRFLLVWGYGQLKVTDIRISGAPIRDYEDVEIETREGLASDTATTLYSATDPLADAPAPLAVSAIRIRVTDQLPRTVNEISGICSSVALDWNGSAWVSRETSNPASLLRHVLQHAGRREPAANADIDLAALQTFHAFCATHSYEFNAIHDTRRSVWEVVRDICAVGRSSPSVSRGRWTAVTDTGTQAIADHLTPINTDNFRRRRSFDDTPHAMLVRFANRNKGWQRDERLVYRDGFSAANATNVQTVSPTGITSPAHAWQFARYHLAVEAVQERWECDQGLENLLAQRGQRVTVQHERLGVGLGSFRVTAVERDGSNRVTALNIDADLRIANAAATYQVKIRNAADVDTLITLDSLAVGAVRRLPFGSATATDVVVGDLVSVGVRGAVQTQGLVTAVRRRGGLTGGLTMIPWTPAVYTAESGGAPAFVSNLSDLPSPLPPVVIDNIDSGIGVRQRIGTVVAPRMAINVNPIPVAGVRAECQLRRPMETEFGPSEIESEGVTRLVIGGLDAGETYSVRLRWVEPQADRVGDWTTESHTIEVLRPNNPGGFSIREDNGFRRYTWRPPSDEDLAGIRIRYGAAGTTWDNMTALHEGLLQTSPWWAYDPPASDDPYAFEIRSVDTDGLESTGVRLDGDDGITLGPVRGVGRFHELQAFKKQALSAAAPSTPTDGSFNFSTGTFTPPTGWVANWPAHDSTEVVYAIAATAHDQGGDPWNATAGDWSSPAIISDAGDINIIYRRGTAATPSPIVPGTGLDYGAPARPDPSDGIPADWHDDVGSVPAGPGRIYVSVGLRRRGETLFTWGSPALLEPLPAISAVEVVIYQKIANNAALPAVPTAATWNHVTRTMGSIGSWSQIFPTYNAATERVACTLATGFSDSTLTAWSTVRICEAAGDLNAVYRREAAGDTPTTPSAGTSRVPGGWVDNPSSLVGAGLAWMSVGHRPWGSATWTWDAPTRIEGLDGSDGEDGTPGRAGLTGSAGRITRETRVADRASANASTEWHMTSATWDNDRTVNLGGITAEERGLLGRIEDGGLVTLFHDPDNWADFSLTSVTYGTTPLENQARIRLGYIEHIGTPPLVGDAGGTTLHVHYTPAGRDGAAGEGGDGLDGTTYRSLTAYMAIDIGTNVPTNPNETPESGDHDWGSYNFTNDTFTPPTGWAADYPDVGDNKAIYAVFTVADDGSGNPWHAGVGDWFGPRLVYQDTDVLFAYRASTSVPGTPGATSGLPTGWSAQPPTTGSGLVYITIGYRRRGQTLYTWGQPTQLQGQDATADIIDVTWRFGDTAPQSNLGDDGDFYLESNTGLIYAKIAGEWTYTANFAGAGTEVWHTGTGVPGNTLGADGDYYFRSGGGATAAEVYAKANGIWGKILDVDRTGGSGFWHSGIVNPDPSLGALNDWFINTVRGDIFEKTAADTWTKRLNLFFVKDANVFTNHLARNAVTEAQANEQARPFPMWERASGRLVSDTSARGVVVPDGSLFSYRDPTATTLRENVEVIGPGSTGSSWTVTGNFYSTFGESNTADTTDLDIIVRNESIPVNSVSMNLSYYVEYIFQTNQIQTGVGNAHLRPGAEVFFLFRDGANTVIRKVLVESSEDTYSRMAGSIHLGWPSDLLTPESITTIVAPLIINGNQLIPIPAGATQVAFVVRNKGGITGGNSTIKQDWTQIGGWKFDALYIKR